jgi:predicted secreted protein|nr:MAG TPA: hypothetical protein [Caudoviricetes sp.]
MSENLKIEIAVLIENIITLIVFSILAIIFQKWWIVLISVLFFSYTENKKETKNDRRKNTESN